MYNVSIKNIFFSLAFKKALKPNMAFESVKFDMPTIMNI